jgi:hypothetical protein
MKKMISKFADSLLSREDLKRVKGGYGNGNVQCSYTACWGSDCFNISGSCSSPDPVACSWYAGGSQPGAAITNIHCA